MAQQLLLEGETIGGLTLVDPPGPGVMPPNLSREELTAYIRNSYKTFGQVSERESMYKSRTSVMFYLLIARNSNVCLHPCACSLLNLPVSLCTSKLHMHNWNDVSCVLNSMVLQVKQSQQVVPEWYIQTWMRHDQAMRAYKPIPMQYVQVLYMAHAEEMPEFPTNAFVPWVRMCRKRIIVHIVAQSLDHECPHRSQAASSPV